MPVQYFEPMDPGRAGDVRAQLDELALFTAASACETIEKGDG